jgi:hypothetical protein
MSRVSAVSRSLRAVRLRTSPVSCRVSPSNELTGVGLVQIARGTSTPSTGWPGQLRVPEPANPKTGTDRFQVKGFSSPLTP